MDTKSVDGTVRLGTSLLDKLPSPDRPGKFDFQGHWWRNDRDDVAQAIAKLGFALREISQRIENARRANNLDDTRGGIIQALITIEEALTPIFGIESLWPVSEAVDTMEYAANGKRHWLTALASDDVPIRQQAPKRVLLQALAAATLAYFDGLLPGKTQEQIALDISKAMAEGGFHVRRDRQLDPPSARTIQDWRARHSPGKRANRRALDPKLRRAFDDFTNNLNIAGSLEPAEKFYQRALLELTHQCWMGSEIPRSKKVPAAKSGP